MISHFRPSDRPGRQSFRERERVLYELEYGRPEVGIIEQMVGNNRAIIDGGSILIRSVKHRLQRSAGPDAVRRLLLRLRAAYAASPSRYEARRSEIVWAWNREHRPHGQQKRAA